MLRRLVIWLSVLMACALLYRSSIVWCEEEAANEAKTEERPAAEDETKSEEAKAEEEAQPKAEAVSYTHLTLPTIYSV